MSLPVEKDEYAYQSLSWKLRLLIRLIIFLMNILDKHLRQYSMSPVFAIYDNSDEIEIDWDGPDEEEDLLQ